jgi:hypothetical protein
LSKPVCGSGSPRGWGSECVLCHEGTWSP